MAETRQNPKRFHRQLHGPPNNTISMRRGAGEASPDRKQPCVSISVKNPAPRYSRAVRTVHTLRRVISTLPHARPRIEDKRPAAAELEQRRQSQ
jgi:hypothetical protein